MLGILVVKNVFLFQVFPINTTQLITEHITAAFESMFLLLTKKKDELSKLEDDVALLITKTKERLNTHLNDAQLNEEFIM